jgi:hypothetical protein
MRPHNPITALPPTRLFDHSKYTISLGFILVLILLTAVAVIGLTHMATINARMNVIVNVQNVKTDLVGNMRNAARERSISLHRIALMTDPFERDEEYLYFRQMAWDFLKARTALETMHLSQVEAKTLLDLKKPVHEAVAIQEEIYNLVLEGQVQEANERLLKEAISAQNQVLAHLSGLARLTTRSHAPSGAHGAKRIPTGVLQHDRPGLAVAWLRRGDCVSGGAAYG